MLNSERTLSVMPLLPRLSLGVMIFLGIILQQNPTTLLILKRNPAESSLLALMFMGLRRPVLSVSVTVVTLAALLLSY